MTQRKALRCWLTLTAFAQNPCPRRVGDGREHGHDARKHVAGPREVVAEVAREDQELLAATVGVLREPAARVERHQRRAPGHLRATKHRIAKVMMLRLNQALRQVQGVLLPPP